MTAEQDKPGLVCPNCGDADLYVCNVETVEVRGGTIRWYEAASADSYLVCRNCACCYDYDVLDDGDTIDVDSLEPRRDLLP